MRFSKPLNFNLANGFADPLGCARFGGPKEDFRCGLRQHGFSIIAISRLHFAVTSSLLGSNRKLSAVILSDPSTPVRWCGALGSISIQYSVPLTRRSISAGLDIHATSSFGVGRKVIRWAKIFCGASTKNLLVT